MTTILFSYASGDGAFWKERLEAEVPGAEVRIFPEVGNPEDVEFAVVWAHPPGDLLAYPNLRAILSLGAGVEHVLRDPDLPDGVPVVRLVDRALTRDVTQHCLHWVLHFQRRYHVYRDQQARRHWARAAFPAPEDFRVGILGIGELGSALARLLLPLGFAVAGWSRDPKSVDGVTSFHGAAGLPGFLAATDMLVGLLPRTPETEGLLNRQRLALLPQGAFLLNVGRGATIVDDDLIALLDEGHLAQACLDVFREEPLPAGSPFWTHPKVIVTPHAAGPTNDASAVREIAGNIRRVMRGETPHPVVRRDLGY
jgi:glyoxylate/hydroxypyruvate reductase A